VNTKESTPQVKAVAAPTTAVALELGPERRRHWWKIVAFMILWFTVLLYAAVIAKALPAKAKHEDFSTLYTSAAVLRQGGNPYHADLKSSAQRLGLMIGKIEHPGDPPSFLLCFELLTLLQPGPAFWVWTGLNMAALGASLVLLFRREQGLTAYTIWVIVGLVMLYPPVGDHLLWANHKLILLLILVMMLLWLERANDGVAGASLAVAGLLRVFPLLLGLYLLLIGQWRAIAWCLASLAVGGMVTLALVGFENCQGFLFGLLYFSGRDWTTLPNNISVTATVSRIFFCLHPHMTPRFELASRALGFATALIFVGFSIKATLATRSQHHRVGRIFALWVLTAVIVSPQAWPLDLCLLLIAWIEMAAAVPRREVSRRALCAGVASYLATWVFYIHTEIYFQYLVTHQQSLAWMIGAFPAALLAYVAIYWFTIDPQPLLERGVSVEDRANMTRLQTTGLVQ
jgi:glycosyl transferase family 87